MNAARALILLLCLSAPATAAGTAAAVTARHGIVVSAQHEASDAGLAILQAGGNAVDAAVAVGYALAVVDPCCGNIGGGGFMLIRLADGRSTVLDFRESAPAAATRTMYLGPDGKPDNARSRRGWLAAAVPGTVMGLDRALAEYGRLDRKTVMAPAIRLARDGFVLGGADAAPIAGHAELLQRDDAAARMLLRPDGMPYRAGERLVQHDLAETLQLIAETGPDAFYRGPIAAGVAAAAKAGGGILTAADFAAYTVNEKLPVACAYRSDRVLSAPLPSSGGTVLCEMLNVLSGWDMAAAGFGSVRSIHLMTETMRHAYFDRNSRLGDPAFVPDRSTELLAPDHAAAIRAAVDPDKATPSAVVGPGLSPREKPETTHYSVVDTDGNAVAVTYTINGFFGAGVAAPGTGFLLNDEMDDFTAAPDTPNMFGLVQGEANAIAPGKRPLSSMTPTIVEKDGRPVLVLGSPGGPRIISTVLEVLTDIVDDRLSPEAAVDAPRFHHQWLPDKLYYEQGGFAGDTVAALAAMGYHLIEQRPWGAVELIAVGDDGSRTGVSDLRRPAGAARGY